MSTPPVVLIVEESPAVREALRERLNGPYRILEADRLSEAQLRLKETASCPDLILSDLRAADQQALALYRRVRGDPALEATPVLLLVPPAEEGAPATDAEGARRVVPDAISPQKLRRLVGHHLAAEGRLPGPPVVPEAPLTETIETVVKTRLGDPDFTVETLAEAVDLSRRQLTRRMKDVFDATPAAYVRARRVDRAKTLLAAGPDTIAAVAEAVGFASPSAFSKAFREATGCSPSTYAERNAE